MESIVRQDGQNNAFAYRLQRSSHGQAQATEGQQAHSFPAAEVNRAEQMALASQLRQLLRIQSIQLVLLQLNLLKNRRDLGQCNTARRSQTCVQTPTLFVLLDNLAANNVHGKRK